MVCYSSAEFCQDWRYAIEKDLTAPDGEDFQYASDGRQQWGDEITKLGFDANPQNGCVSGDGRLLALAVEDKIHVFDTDDFNKVCVLIGHTNEVSQLAFHPHDSNLLVSGQERDYERTGTSQKHTIIVWNIKEWQQKPTLDNNELGVATKAAATAVASEFERLGATMSADQIRDLETEFTPAVNHVAAKRAVSDQLRMHGRLVTHFQSHVFSPSGKWMLYLPGEAPRSNRSDDWISKSCRLVISKIT